MLLEQVLEGQYGTLFTSGLKIECQYPRAVKGTLPCLGSHIPDVTLNGCAKSVFKNPMALITRVGVSMAKFPTWPYFHYGHLIIPKLAYIIPHLSTMLSDVW